MKASKQFPINLLYSGVDQENSFLPKYGICKGVNLLCLIIIAINVACGPGYFFFTGKLSILIGSIIEILLLLCVIFLNGRGKHVTANVTLFIILNLATFYFGVILGEKANVPLMLVLIAGLTMFVFENRRIIISCISFSLFMIILLAYFFKHPFVTPIKTTSQIAELMQYTSLTIVSCLVLLLFYLFAGLKQKSLDDEKSKSNGKTKFIRTFAHEIGTVLMPIVTTSEFIGAYIHDSQGKEELSLLVAGCNNLDRFTKNLLNQAKIEGGVLRKAQYRTTNVLNLISNLIFVYRGLANKFKKTLQLQMQMGFPTSIYTDALKVEMIASNLISNAIKYSPENTAITIYLGYKDDNWFIEVENEGDPIPENLKAKIFDPYITENTQGINIRGTGLGLSITKDSVDLLKGKIEVTSESGEKTIIFRATLPLTVDNEIRISA